MNLRPLDRGIWSICRLLLLKPKPLFDRVSCLLKLEPRRNNIRKRNDDILQQNFVLRSSFLCDQCVNMTTRQMWQTAPGCTSSSFSLQSGASSRVRVQLLLLLQLAVATLQRCRWKLQVPRPRTSCFLVSPSVCELACWVVVFRTLGSRAAQGPTTFIRPHLMTDSADSRLRANI